MPEEKASVIPEGLDPHEFREKVQRTLDSATSERLKATLRAKLAAIDEFGDELEKEEPPSGPPPKEEAPPKKKKRKSS